VHGSAASRNIGKIGKVFEACDERDPFAIGGDRRIIDIASMN